MYGWERHEPVVENQAIFKQKVEARRRQKENYKVALSKSLYSTRAQQIVR